MTVDYSVNYSDTYPINYSDEYVNGYFEKDFSFRYPYTLKCVKTTSSVFR